MKITFESGEEIEVTEKEISIELISCVIKLRSFSKIIANVSDSVTLKMHVKSLYDILQAHIYDYIPNASEYDKHLTPKFEEFYAKYIEQITNEVETNNGSNDNENGK